MSLRTTISAAQVALLLVVGCQSTTTTPPSTASEPALSSASGERAASPAVDPSAAHTVAPMSPVSVRFLDEAAPQAGPRLRLRAEVQRRVVMDKPLPYRLLLPAGVRMAEGQAAAGELPPNPQPAIDELVFDLELSDGIPTADVVLEAGIQGRSFGFHARVPYRFGRPPPTHGQLPRADRPVRIGGRDLGEPVLLAPDPDQTPPGPTTGGRLTD